MEARIDVAAAIELGETPLGLRRMVPITGGTFQGPRLSGTVLAGGADWQLIRPDGAAVIEARYALQAQDGARIAVLNRGIRHAPPDIMRRLAAGEPVDPSAYYFRTTPCFETAPGPHAWLSRAVFIGAGERHPDAVVLRVWKVC